METLIKEDNSIEARLKAIQKINEEINDVDHNIQLIRDNRTPTTLTLKNVTEKLGEALVKSLNDRREELIENAKQLMKS